MKPKLPHLIVVWLATTLAAHLQLGAADPPAPTADREAFIRGFKRIGLNTTPGDAMMLRILVESSRAKRGIEVGTATGYGALHLGVAFERNGGKLLTVDIDPDMVRQARANLTKAGLDQTVQVIEGDALKVLPALEGEFDFVFLDAVKQDYLKYFEALRPKLKPGALVVADNVIRSGRDMRDFLEFMATNPEWDHVIVRASDEKGDGMAICYWKGRTP